MTVEFDEDDILWDYYEDLKEWDKVELLPNGGIFILDKRSLMQKALKITEQNLNKIQLEYDLDPSEMDPEFGPVVGFWLIADFGAKKPESYIDAALFEELFDIVPKEELTLKNDYVAIVPKGSAAML